MPIATIDTKGYRCQTYEEILADISEQVRAIYGDDIYIEPDSKDGQLLGVLSQAIADTAAIGRDVYNQFSPASAVGEGLSSVVKVNGISRNVPTNSQAELTLTGAPFKVLNHAYAMDDNGNKWLIPNGTTLPSPSGLLTVTCYCQTAGAIVAQPHTITSIGTPQKGWYTVDNAAISSRGAPVENDIALRRRQKTSVAIPSLTVLSGLVGAVASLDGVEDVQYRENDTGATNGDGLPPRSIAIVVDGGIDSEIAATIRLKKAPGVTTFGTTSVIVNDNGLSQSINFYRVTDVFLDVTVNVAPRSTYSSAQADRIRTAIAAEINAYVTGQDVFPARLIAVAYDAAQGTADIDAVTVSQQIVNFHSRARTTTARISVIV